MRVEKDFKEFIELLNVHEVKYLIVGGFAYSLYVEPRFTKDIDFFIESSSENSEKLMKALNEFGFGSIGLKSDDFCEPDQIIQLGVSPLRIDIVTSIEGITFKKAWKKKTSEYYGDVSAFFISKEDLILNKKSTGRLQDQADVEKLDKI